MEQLIKDLKHQVEKLEKQYVLTKRKEYEAQKHKTFYVGDWVTNGTDVGVVGWVENKAMDISESDGYFGLDIKNGSLGFRAPCKRDEYELLDENKAEYYIQIQAIHIAITGEEIDSILYGLQSHHGINLIKALKEYRERKMQEPTQ